MRKWRRGRAVVGMRVTARKGYIYIYILYIEREIVAKQEEEQGRIGG